VTKKKACGSAYLFVTIAPDKSKAVTEEKRMQRAALDRTTSEKE
jgi:hypothetical protein